MAESDKTLLLGKLQVESNDMIFKFSEIKRNFRLFMKQKEKAGIIEKIKSALIDFLQIPPLRTEDKSFSLQESLNNATEVCHINSILSKYCSFYNYQILENIFIEIEYKDGIDALKKHKENLTKYAAARIYHFPSGLGICNRNHAIIAVKLDTIYEQTLIVHLLTFHKNLCELLSAELDQCPLDGLKPGCICVTIHLLDHLVKKIFPLSEDQQEELKMLTCNRSKIRSLTCESFRYHIANGKFSKIFLLEKQSNNA